MNCFFFFNDTAPTEIYTLSLHDALPILWAQAKADASCRLRSSKVGWTGPGTGGRRSVMRSEEHTSELQSHHDLVCRLLLEKKKNNPKTQNAQPHHTISIMHNRNPTFMRR